MPSDQPQPTSATYPPQNYAPGGWSPEYSPQPAPTMQQPFPQQYSQPQYPRQPIPQQPNAWPLHRWAAIGVTIAGLSGLFSSLLSLYSVTVDPSRLGGDPDDMPTGTVEIGLGFYDTIPFNSPAIALVIPVTLLLAGLSAIPAIASPHSRPSGLPALFAVSGTLLTLILMLTNPLPSITFTGEIADGIEDEIGRGSDNLVDPVLSVSPGLGLILSIVFGLLASGCAIVLFVRSIRQPNQATPTQQY